MNPELSHHAQNSLEVDAAQVLDDFFAGATEPQKPQGILPVPDITQNFGSDLTYPVIPYGPKTYSSPAITRPDRGPVPDLALAISTAAQDRAMQAQIANAYERYMARARATPCLDPNCRIVHGAGSIKHPPTFDTLRSAVTREMGMLASQLSGPTQTPPGEPSKLPDRMLEFAYDKFCKNVLNSVASALLPSAPHTGGCACCRPSGGVFYAGNISQNLALPNALLAPSANACAPGCTHHHEHKGGKGKRRKGNKSPSD